LLKQLGANPNQIYNWKQQQEEQANGAMLNDNERTELLKLRDWLLLMLMNGQITIK